MRKLLMIFFLAAIVTTNRAYAASDFSLSFDVMYDIAEDASASIVKDIHFTNLTTNAYPTAYYLDLPFDATDVAAFDKQGKVPFDLLVQDGINKARFSFNDSPLGLNSETEITVTYRTQSVVTATSNGRTISIPPISSSSDVGDYTATVTFPASWGTPSSMNPQPDQPYVWHKQQLFDSPIVISFGPVLGVTATPVPTQNAIPLYMYGILAGTVIFGILFAISHRHQ